MFETIGFVKKAEKTKSLGLVCRWKHGWLVTSCYLQWIWRRKVSCLIGAPIVAHLRHSGKKEGSIEGQPWTLEKLNIHLERLESDEPNKRNADERKCVISEALFDFGGY